MKLLVVAYRTSRTIAVSSSESLSRAESWGATAWSAVLAWVARLSASASATPASEPQPVRQARTIVVLIRCSFMRESRRDGAKAEREAGSVTLPQDSPTLVYLNKRSGPPDLRSGGPCDSFMAVLESAR